MLDKMREEGKGSKERRKNEGRDRDKVREEGKGKGR